MFKTKVQCEQRGIFKGAMVVSMRPFKKEQLDQVIEITSKYPKVHGAPVYCGLDYAKELGIEDITKPDFG